MRKRSIFLILAILASLSLPIFAEPPKPELELPLLGTLEQSRSASSVPFGCFYACYDAEESSAWCPPGQNFAFVATGSAFGCALVGGGYCISSGCSVHISSCYGFAGYCGSGGGGGF